MLFLFEAPVVMFYAGFITTKNEVGCSFMLFLFEGPVVTFYASFITPKIEVGCTFMLLFSRTCCNVLCWFYYTHN